MIDRIDNGCLDDWQRLLCFALMFFDFIGTGYYVYVCYEWIWFDCILIDWVFTVTWRVHSRFIIVRIKQPSLYQWYDCVCITERMQCTCNNGTCIIVYIISCAVWVERFAQLRFIRQTELIQSRRKRLCVEHKI